MSTVLREKNSLPFSRPDEAYVYDLYQDRILGRNKLGSSTVENTAVIMWDTLHSHEVMADFSKHKIKHHPYIKFIFVRFLIAAKIYGQFQNIYQMNIYIKVLSNNSYRHNDR